jgi:tetratricopeptide (TPR) repeat protein
MNDVKAHLEQARAFQAQADYRSAERSLLLALEAATQLYSDPSLVVEALQMLSGFYGQMGQHTEALAQAAWALELLKAKLGAQDPALRPVMLTMATWLTEDGQTAEAQRLESAAAHLKG